jgi:hypothetical protein
MSTTDLLSIGNDHFRGHRALNDIQEDANDKEKYYHFLPDPFQFINHLKPDAILSR